MPTTSSSRILSHWLTRQLGNDELRRKVTEIGTDELAPAQRDAVIELLDELGTAAPGERGRLEVVVRETSRRSSTATSRGALAARCQAPWCLAPA